MVRPAVLSTSNMIQGKYMNFRRRLSCALTVLVSSLVASTGQATTVKPMNIVDLIDHSETIVAGRVEKVTDGFTAAGLPYTEVTVHVLDRFRGASGSSFTVPPVRTQRAAHHAERQGVSRRPPRGLADVQDVAK